MAITPQAIKDQEFQVKLRGFDTVEVKAYLELIAEEFFELLEQVRQQVEDLEVIAEERDNLKNSRDKLQNELDSIRDSSEEIKTEYAERDTEIAALQAEINQLKQDITIFEEQSRGKDQDLAEVVTKLKKREDAIEFEKERNDKLTRRLDDLEKQNEELRSEELDFKSTLIAAQQFTSDLKKKSEKEAQGIVDRAKADAEQLRQDTFAELAKYPSEIERLKKRRNEVREELEEVLKLCLDNLDMFKAGEDEDFGELFRQMQQNNPVSTADSDGTVNDHDDLDSLDVNFDLTGGQESLAEETFSMKEEEGEHREDFT